MANQTWKKVDRIFTTPDGGLRLKAEVIYGGRESKLGRSQVRHIPTTWANVSILPNPNETVLALGKRLGISDIVEKFVREHGEQSIRQDGIVCVTMTPGNSSPHDTDQIGHRLAMYATEKKLTLPAETTASIKQFLDAHITRDALIEAGKVFDRTGGKGTGAMGAGM
jgi:hypothetical protein